jgi:hypothetical protein
MTFIKTGTAAILAMGLVGGVPAFAGNKTTAPTEPVIVAPIAPQPVSFNWTGAYAGAQLGLGNLNVRGATTRSSGFAGAFVGYRQDLGNVVLGVELEGNAHGANRNSGNRARQISSAALYVGAGVKVSQDGRSLLSLKAGPARVSWRANGRTRSASGFSAGVDFDQMLNDNAFLRVGLRHTATPKRGNRARSSSTSAVIGIAYKF